MNRLVTIFVAGFIALMILSSTVFVVDQRRYAIVFALGEVREVISTPGLHFKLPPPFQNVLYLDKRILTIDTPDADRFITAEKKNILVDAFVKWRIIAPRLYYVSFNGDENRARDRMSQIVKAALNDEITKRTVILAEAFRDAEKIKGEGDAKASQIYAEAFGKNPEFYKFYRSLEAYRATFKNHGDVMVIDSNSEFFKYFRNPGVGGAGPAPAKK